MGSLPKHTKSSKSNPMRKLIATLCLTIAVLSLAFFLAFPAKAAGENRWFCKTTGALGLDHGFVVTLPAYGSGAGTIVLTQPNGGKPKAHGRVGRVGTGRLVWKSAGINDTYNLLDLSASGDTRHAVALSPGGQAIRQCQSKSA
jgi:hypothetical protein